MHTKTHGPSSNDGRFKFSLGISFCALGGLICLISFIDL